MVLNVNSETGLYVLDPMMGVTPPRSARAGSGRRHLSRSGPVGTGRQSGDDRHRYAGRRICRYHLAVDRKRRTPHRLAPASIVRQVIKAADGEDIREHFITSKQDAIFGTRRCDLCFGPHAFAGDLKRYDIQVVPVNGLGNDGKDTSHGCAAFRADGFRGR